ncbi:hypothetical protein [Parazoarcus communis]|uniref:hypothetical protein n=1 Tax=Parazoarcus communis TaxID=41977 RepID=UPI001402BBA8|nr:hypothetical protein [Parazoarcus communis]NMG68582.1 hypothetical protein [Parazoarcus communis SWub3 = DSM 12120]
MNTTFYAFAKCHQCGKRATHPVVATRFDPARHLLAAARRHMHPFSTQSEPEHLALA